ncbi:MAG: GGDEF domain-containing protein [Acidobacteria bacterium]|nr:GGDEF domain-containing protein [Acidobacteriota bacterium]
MRSAGRRAEAAEAVLCGLTATRVPERLAGLLLDLVAGWLGGEGWALVAADEGRGAAWLADRGVPAARRPLMTAAARTAMARGEVLWLDGMAAPAHGRRRACLATLAIPMRSRGRVVAALVGIERREPGPLPELHVGDGRLEPLHALIDGMAGALETALRLKRAETLAAIDDLTGLFNPRFLAASLRREVKRSVRTGRPLSLLFVDLDGFKGINDRHGHLYGSRALVEAAARIQAAARETDLVARYGGDEFALVLPETDREGSLHVAQRVRERIAAGGFLIDDGIDYRLTASVGVATLPDVASTPEELLAAADAAMYAVKARGKDGIEVALVAPARVAPEILMGRGAV